MYKTTYFLKEEKELSGNYEEILVPDLFDFQDI
jgi:hypothetical protein